MEVVTRSYRALQPFANPSPFFKPWDISKSRKCVLGSQPSGICSAGEMKAYLSHELKEKGQTGHCPNPSPGIAWKSLVGQLHARALQGTSAETSLRKGHWVKLICGASFEDIAEIRNLSLIYTLAGGVNAAKRVLESLGSAVKSKFPRPWIMISINDDVDPHFRKAEFDSKYCPSNCPRPCETACPALAIKFQQPIRGGENAIPLNGGVVMERCYGCGRCLPVCPLGLISASTYVRSAEEVARLIQEIEVDAIEIHTGAGHLEAFKSLVAKLGSSLSLLKLVAVSVPDLDNGMIPAMAAMYGVIQPFLKGLNLWQLDGRPMSGDIGAGATWAAVNLGAHVAASIERPPGFLQLAGGTSVHTVRAMEKKGLCGPTMLANNGDMQSRNKSTSLEYSQKHEVGEALIAGVAYGGYARKIVSKFLQKMSTEQQENDQYSSQTSSSQLEDYPSLMIGALQEAITLVDTVKNISRA